MKNISFKPSYKIKENPCILDLSSTIIKREVEEVNKCLRMGYEGKMPYINSVIAFFERKLFEHNIMDNHIREFLYEQIQPWIEFVEWRRDELPEHLKNSFKLHDTYLEEFQDLQDQVLTH